jgi:hypothetical protein
MLSGYRKPEEVGGSRQNGHYMGSSDQRTHAQKLPEMIISRPVPQNPPRCTYNLIVISIYNFCQYDTVQIL